MVNAPMRVAVSGAGYVMPFHVRAWRAAGADVVALFDPDRSRAAACAEEHGIAAAFDDFDTMLRAGGADVLDVASPREFHVDQSLKGLDAGLAVMCQKPVAVSMMEAQVLERRLSEGGRFMVHENWRFRPEYRMIAEWIDAGLLGPIYHAECQMRTSALLAGPDGIRPALRRQPFFAHQHRLLVAEVLIHHLDMCRRLLGELDLVTGTLLRTQDDLPGETHASLVFERSNGAHVLVSGNMAAPGAPPSATDRLEILGGAGRVVFEAGKLAFSPAKGEAETLDLSQRNSLQESFDATMAHFVERLGDRGAFETSIWDNLKTLALVDAVYERVDAMER